MVRISITSVLLGGAMLLAAACTKKVVGTSMAPAPSRDASAQLAAPADPNQLGAENGLKAVEAFLLGARTQNLRAMSLVWGNDKSPVSERIPREELEKRLIVLQCLLTHDKWSLLSEAPQLLSGGRQEYQVRLQQKQLSARTKFTTVAGRGGRWFVEDIQVDELKDFCR